MIYWAYLCQNLKENNMPVEMVRAILTNQPLPENFTTKWKFAGEIK